MWAALTLGFYGFLHAGGIYHIPHPPLSTKQAPSPQGCDPYSRPLLSDHQRVKDDQDRRSATKILVGATGTNTCPVRAMQTFLRAATHPRSTPLFTLSSRQYLTRTRLTTCLLSLLEASGLTPKQAAQYSSHSLRIGAATEAAAAGLPTWLIQKAGRWQSDAYRRYIRPPTQALLSAAPALARHPHT